MNGVGATVDNQIENGNPPASLSPEQSAAQMAERPKLYYRVTQPHGPPFVLDPGELEEFLRETEEEPTGVEKVYLTDAEYEALPEFES